MAEDDAWMRPDNLARMDSELSVKSVEELAGKGDFGSYAAANRGTGLANSGIEHHNLIHVDSRVQLYAAILPRHRFAICADMGCGLGMTSDAMRRRFGADSVDGYDISSDAVEFANRTFAPARFHRLAIAQDSKFEHLFDLILCQELYAFTRTTDWAFQQAMIANFMAHLQPGGLLLIELCERDAERTLLTNLPALKTLCRDQGWSYRRQGLPFDRIWRMVPTLALARPLSWLIAKACGRHANVALLIGK